MSIGILATLQAQMKARLEAQEFFAEIDIITEDIGDIQNAIDTAIGKIGVCVVLATVLAKEGNSNMPGPYWGDIRIIARVFENVIINRSEGGSGTGIPASTIAEAIAFFLNQFTPEGAGSCIAIESIGLGNDPSALCYDVEMKTADGLTEAPTRS